MKEIDSYIGVVLPREDLFDTTKITVVDSVAPEAVGMKLNKIKTLNKNANISAVQYSASKETLYIYADDILNTESTELSSQKSEEGRKIVGAIRKALNEVKVPNENELSLNKMIGADWQAYEEWSRLGDADKKLSGFALRRVEWQLSRLLKNFGKCNLLTGNSEGNKVVYGASIELKNSNDQANNKNINFVFMKDGTRSGRYFPVEEFAGKIDCDQGNGLIRELLDKKVKPNVPTQFLFRLNAEDNKNEVVYKSVSNLQTKEDGKIADLKVKMGVEITCEVFKDGSFRNIKPKCLTSEDVGKILKKTKVDVQAVSIAEDDLVFDANVRASAIGSISRMRAFGTMENLKAQKPLAQEEIKEKMINDSREFLSGIENGSCMGKHFSLSKLFHRVKNPGASNSQEPEQLV